MESYKKFINERKEYVGLDIETGKQYGIEFDGASDIEGVVLHIGDVDNISTDWMEKFRPYFKKSNFKGDGKSAVIESLSDTGSEYFVIERTDADKPFKYYFLSDGDFKFYLNEDNNTTESLTNENFDLHADGEIIDKTHKTLMKLSKKYSIDDPITDKKDVKQIEIASDMLAEIVSRNKE